MKLTIYEMGHSPYCIPITQALEALGVQFERVAIPNWDRRQLIELTGGAYYQVPVLVHGEQVVYESTDDSLDVAQYVDQQFGDGRLFPDEDSGLQEILVNHIEGDLEGLTFRLCDIHYLPTIEDPVARAMTIRHKERRFGRGCVEVWRRDEARLRDSVNQMLERFDRTLRHRSFIMGSAPRYVDFALFGVIGNYTYGDKNRLSTEHDALAEWVGRLREFRFSAPER